MGEASETRLLNNEEAEALVEAAGSARGRAFLALLWETGARADTLLEAELSDGDVVLRSGGPERRYRPSDRARELLEEWLAERGEEGEGLWGDLDMEGARELVEAASERSGVDRQVALSDFRWGRASIVQSLSGEAERRAVLAKALGFPEGSEREPLLTEEEFESLVAAAEDEGTREELRDLWGSDFSITSLSRGRRERLTRRLSELARRAGVEGPVTPDVLVYSGYRARIEGRAEETLRKMGWTLEDEEEE